MEFSTFQGHSLLLIIFLHQCLPPACFSLEALHCYSSWSQEDIPITLQSGGFYSNRINHSISQARRKFSVSLVNSSWCCKWAQMRAGETGNGTPTAVVGGVGVTSSQCRNLWCERLSGLCCRQMGTDRRRQSQLRPPLRALEHWLVHCVQVF